MKRRSIILAVAAFVVIVGIAVATTSFATQYLHASSKDSECSGQHAAHNVTITGGTLSATSIQATRCDTLSITNQDDTLRLIAFGKHDQHQVYNGITEQSPKRGESISLTLNQSGTYTFHDHLHDELVGIFTVNQ